MKNSARTFINKWDYDDLLDFFHLYSGISNYAKQTRIKLSSLADFNTRRLLAKQGANAHCLTAISNLGKTSAIGYLQSDFLLSKTTEKSVYFGRYFCNENMDIESATLMTKVIDDACLKIKPDICRIKCDNHLAVRESFIDLGFEHYYSTIKFIHNHNLSQHPNHTPTPDGIKVIASPSSFILNTLLSHTTSERYHHPFLSNESLYKYYRIWWSDKLSNPNSVVFQVIDTNGDLLAFAVCSKPSYMQQIVNTPLYVLDFLYTYPAYRNKRIGMTFLQSIIQKLSPAIIETSCSMHNKPITRLLEKCGFMRSESYDFFAKNYSNDIPAKPYPTMPCCAREEK